MPREEIGHVIRSYTLGLAAHLLMAVRRVEQSHLGLQETVDELKHDYTKCPDVYEIRIWPLVSL